MPVQADSRRNAVRSGGTDPAQAAAGRKHKQIRRILMEKNGVGLTVRLMGALSYFTWVGFLVILIFTDRKNKFLRWHLNQSLVINTFFTVVIGLDLLSLNFFPDTISEIIDTIAVVAAILILIGWLMGWSEALRGEEKVVPILGNIHWLS